MTINVNVNFRNYKSNGQHKEQALAYVLTGEIRKADKVPFYMGSDIPEYEMSVKSSKFSLMNGNACIYQDFDGIVEEFFSRVKSRQFAYVTNDMVAYVMNIEQFRQFVYMFCGLERESQKNGGRYKVKMRAESKKTIAWLEKNIK